MGLLLGSVQLAGAVLVRRDGLKSGSLSSRLGRCRRNWADRLWSAWGREVVIASKRYRRLNTRIQELRKQSASSMGLAISSGSC